jgi:two-component system chemotaxis response regulator CheB
LPSILAHRTKLRVATAEEGAAPVPGSVHVAPPDRHLLVRPDRTLGLGTGERVNFCRPSADVLFRSVAEAHGGRAVAVVLTGLGQDGARGLRDIRRRGGFAIAQDEASSQAFHMPLAAIDIGQADLALPLHRIAAALEVLAAPQEALVAGGPSAAGIRGGGWMTGPSRPRAS